MSCACLGLVVGGDDRHAARLRDHALEPPGQAIDLGVIGDAIAERARLADIEHVAARIEHPIDAGARGERLQDVADRRHAGFQIGLAGAAHGIGLRLLVEARGGVGLIGAVGFAARHERDLGRVDGEGKQCSCESTALAILGSCVRRSTGDHPCANSLVPTTPITISAMKAACTPLTLSPKKIMPPMITPTAPRPVHTA